MPYLALSLVLLWVLVSGVSLVLWRQTVETARTALENEADTLAESIAGSTVFSLASVGFQQSLYLEGLKHLAREIDLSLSGDPQKDGMLLARVVSERGLEAGLIYDARLHLLISHLTPPKTPGPGSFADGEENPGPGPARIPGFPGPAIFPGLPSSPFGPAPPGMTCSTEGPGFLVMKLKAFLLSGAREAVLSEAQSPFCGGGPPVLAVAVRRRDGGAVILKGRPNPKRPGRHDLGRLFATLTLSPKIVFVALLGPDNRILAHSDRSRVGRIFRPDADRAPECLVRYRPVSLDSGSRATLVLALSTRSTENLLNQARINILSFAGAALFMGAAGLMAIFHLQRRNDRRVKDLEEDVRRARHLASLGQMAAQVAHEVRNPLNAISLTVGRLAREVKVAPENEDGFRRLSGVIRSEIGRLNGIVEEFLALARAPRLALAEADFSALVERVASLYREEAAAAGVSLAVERPSEHLIALLDEEKFLHVAANVVKNAMDACGPGGSVTVTLSRSPGFVSMTVSDTGPGLSPETLDRAFEPFYTTKPQGSGLGLATALAVVREHGGSMTLANRQPGPGAVCTVKLPAA